MQLCIEYGRIILSEISAEFCGKEYRHFDGIVPEFSVLRNSVKNSYKIPEKIPTKFRWTVDTQVSMILGLANHSLRGVISSITQIISTHEYLSRMK